MNVLSLFDGMSCGRIALERANIEVDNYYASEIDKYAIQITQKNYPDTIQLGDINNWKSWKLPHIDLILAGSPCQGFSNAGTGLNFIDPRSRLFFVFVDILNQYKPDYFLLENVKMKKEWQNIISGYVGLEPIKINSALVSAQNRIRLYWTNIQGIVQPIDKGILLKDIIEDGSVDRDKSYCIDANYYKGGTKKNHDSKEFQKLRQSERRMIVRIQGAAVRNQITKQGIEEQLNIRKDGKSNCVVSSFPTKLNGVCIQVGMADDIKGHDIVRRIYSKDGKSPALTTMQGGHREPKISLSTNSESWIRDISYRKLTPLECERLQTVPDNYTSGVSNTQRYKMLGNGWTVDVIAHILSFIPRKEE